MALYKFTYLLTYLPHDVTRKLSYRKDDLAMRHILR